VAKRRDPHLQDITEGELEHGWAGAVEIDNERPNTGLRPDPSARKWVLLGVGTSCLLTAAFVLLAMGTQAPAHAAEIAAPLSKLALGEMQSEMSEMGAGTEPGAHGSASDSTLAASSSAVATVKPRSLAPAAAMNPPPPATAKSAVVAKPAATTKPAAAPKPVAKPTPAAMPTPAVTPKPAATSKLPGESAETPTLPDASADLPDVEPWDDADDEAVREAPTDVEPS
jgi:hypothetical protein